MFTLDVVLEEMSRQDPRTAWAKHPQLREHPSDRRRTYFLMRHILPTVGLIMLPYIGHAQVRSLGLCERSFEANLEPGSRLSMHLRSGEITITGTSAPKIVVSCEIDGARSRGEVEVRFMAADKTADLKVSGGPIDKFRLHIRVPSQTNLLVRSTAGEVKIENVTGDKDASLTAGALTIAVGSPADYSRAEASVHLGGLEAPPWDIEKGGLFRSFKRTSSSGKYYLNAHVGAGDLTLRY